jgi:recombinational DNA repair protein RecT
MHAGPNGRPLHEVTVEGGEFARRSVRGDMIGAYAYAMLPGGVPSEVVRLNIDDIAEIRAKAEGGGTGAFSPWVTAPKTMWKKSALRRLEKLVPVSAGYRQTMAQAQAFIAVSSPTQPLTDGGDDPEEGPAPTPVEAVAGEPVEAPDVPVTDVDYNPQEWGGDPAWDGLSVTKPGTGVPQEVRGDA